MRQMTLSLEKGIVSTAPKTKCRTSWLYKYPFVYKLIDATRLGKKKVKQRIRFLVGENKKVFDVACGYGEMREALDPSCDYAGLDLNEVFINYGRKRGRNIWVEDAVRVPSYPQSDVIIIWDLVHHITTGEVREVLTKALSDAEKVVIVEPSYLGLTRIKIFGRFFDWLFTTLDQDGVNPKRTWRTQQEYIRDFKNFFGLNMTGFKVAVERIGLSLLAVYTRSDNGTP